jgi:hypothetical protein
LALRILSAFLLWTAGRSAYSLYLGQANSDYRFAFEAGFGPAVWIGEALYAFLATGAAVGIWMRSPITVKLALAALAVSASLLLFQFQLTEANPERARAAYAESRRVRGLPVYEDRLAAMFSPAGRRVAWAIGAAMTIGPLALLLARRREFEPDARDQGQ